MGDVLLVVGTLAVLVTALVLLLWYGSKPRHACPQCAAMRATLAKQIDMRLRADAELRAVTRSLVGPVSDDMQRPSPCGRFNVGTRLLARWTKGGVT